MNKVCVVTLFKHNYGAFLQAYALQRFLESIGYEAKVLDYDYYNDRTILGIYIGRIKTPIPFAKMIINRMLRSKVIRKRDAVLEECANKKIKQTEHYHSYRSLMKNPPKADIFIVGSDQVWNPGLSEQGFMSRLLEFVPNGKHVLSSYAASMGVKSVSEDAKNAFRNNLRRFDCISVREADSISLLSPLVNIDIDVHRDPSLLLDAAQWSEFCETIPAKKPYVFIYLAQKSPELVSFAEEIAKKNDWDIVKCPGNVSYTVSNNIIGERFITPMEFVGGIRDAAYVVTNSFHCLVFTIHFKKKAYVILPPKGASRLGELVSNMKLFRLTERSIIKDEEIDQIYENADAFMAKERQHAKEYLQHLNDILLLKLDD